MTKEEFIDRVIELFEGWEIREKNYNGWAILIKNDIKVYIYTHGRYTRS